MYEVGASRRKNHMHTLLKNVMVIPLVTVTFFFFGWWIYWAFPNAFPGIGGIDFSAGTAYTPWSENMGTNMQDRITGVFWAAFAKRFGEVLPEIQQVAGEFNEQVSVVGVNLDLEEIDVVIPATL